MSFLTYIQWCKEVNSQHYFWEVFTCSPLGDGQAQHDWERGVGKPGSGEFKFSQDILRNNLAGNNMPRHWRRLSLLSGCGWRIRCNREKGAGLSRLAVSWPWEATGQAGWHHTMAGASPLTSATWHTLSQSPPSASRCMLGWGRCLSWWLGRWWTTLGIFVVVWIGLDRRARVVVGWPLAVRRAWWRVGVHCGQTSGKDWVLGRAGQVLRGVGGGHWGVGHSVQGELQVSQSLLMFLSSHMNSGLP